MRRSRTLFVVLTLALVTSESSAAHAKAKHKGNGAQQEITVTPLRSDAAPAASGAAAVTHQFVVVPVVDTSKSVGVYAPLLRAELVRIVQAIPQGVPYSILAFGQSVTPVYRGVGGDAAQAEPAIKNLAFRGDGSDIGAGLVAAASEAVSLDGQARALIIPLTDGEPHPLHSSPFAGKGLDVLLGMPAITGDPEMRHLVVRIYGTVRPAATSPNVAVMTSEPNWAEVIARFADSARPSPSPAAAPEHKENRASRAPTVLAAITLALITGAAGWWLLAWRKRSHAESDEQAMLQQVALEEPEEASDPARRFTVAKQDGSESVSLDFDHPSVSINSNFDADIVVDDAASGARIDLEARKDDVHIFIENTGAKPVLVGALAVPVGGRRRLPAAQYIEISVGGGVFTVEEVVLEEEEVLQ